MKLVWYDPNADHPPWIKALADVRRVETMEGYGPSILVHQPPARDIKRRAGNPRRTVRYKEESSRSDVCWRSKSFQRMECSNFGTFRLRHMMGREFGENGRRRKAIHPNIHWPDLLREMAS